MPYGLQRGGAGFDPDRPTDTIDLFELVNDLDARGLELPVLLRFSDILKDRVKRINECFSRAIEEYQYKGVYRGVFPVNLYLEADICRRELLLEIECVAR